MSHRKLIRFLTVVAFALPFTANVALAEDLSDKKESDQSKTLEVTVRNGEIIGREQIRRVFVTCGTNNFVFVAPHGSRMVAKPAMVVVAPADLTDFTYSLTFRILSQVVAEPNLGNMDSYRELARNRFPGGKVMEESWRTAAGRNGLAFDLRVITAGGVERAVCVALIPSAAGVLEFILNADAAKLEDARNTLNAMLRTFRSNEKDGKLEIIPQVVTES